MDKLTELGRQIKKARQEAGTTVEDLAIQCDINPSYLRGIEAGRKTPSHSLLIRICKATNKEPNYFYAPYVVTGGTPDRLDAIIAQMSQQEREQTANVLEAIYPRLKAVTMKNVK